MRSELVTILRCLVFTAFLVATPTFADDSGSPGNRVDLTLAFLDNISSDHLTGFFSYSRKLSSNSKLSLRTGYLDSQFGSSGGTGVGDTSLTWSYLPGSRISVKPWVPRVVGSGISVLLPTGNESQGRGLGATIITPFIGTVITLSEKFYVAPNLLYAYSIDPIVNGKDVRVAVLEIGFTWVPGNNWWLSAFPGYVKDYETDNTTIGGRLSAGKQFDSGWGLSAHFIDLENFTPGVLSTGSTRFRQVYELSVHYTF